MAKLTLAQLERHLFGVEHIQQEIRLVGFWSNNHAQEVLRKWVIQRLDDSNLLAYEKQKEAADRMMEVAKANRSRLAR